MPITDETSKLYLRLLGGWNERDAKAMAGCFSEAGIMIGFDGSIASGREDIEAHLTPIFTDHPTAAFVTIIRSVVEAGSARVLLADVGMVPPGATEINPDANARQTLVAFEVDGEWRTALFQNTPAALHWDEAARAELSAELNAAYKERGNFPD